MSEPVIVKPVLIIPRGMDIEQIKAWVGEYNVDVRYAEPIPLVKR